MAVGPDAESGEVYAPYYEVNDSERETLLPTPTQALQPATSVLKRRFGALHLVLAFFGGIIVSVGVQLVLLPNSCFYAEQIGPEAKVLAPPYVGSTEVHHFPPVSPTNANPTLFPTDVGYPGGTPTGAEPGVIRTAPSYPIQTGAAQLVVPPKMRKNNDNAQEPVSILSKHRHFDLLKSWGNLSPWYSVGKGAFGLDSTPETPETCRVTGLHLLHRHGARYPTAWARFGGPAKLAERLHAKAKDWSASGELKFLNEWTYKLGEELLTPFGRQQLYDLGVSMRLKYGFLLKNFTDTNTIPVFRTESQHRMLHSALNFALGFFGYPLEGQYQQSITIEAEHFNNTLAPYYTCPNSRVFEKSERGHYYVKEWTARYLKHALRRLQRELKGFELSIEDVFTMQQACAYETVAIGYSKFCELFTEEEWDGFNYALDLTFWYNSAFGSPTGRVQGIGWVKELVARLTSTPISEHNSSTNSTLDDNPITFPLNQALYVDATHEVVILNIITALNLTTFAETGPLPFTHIPRGRSFEVAKLAPFASNVQFQLLECTSVPGQQIRVIINDGVAPLTGIKGCPHQRDGMCPVDTFVAAQKELIEATDFVYDCYGDWTVPEGTKWNTTTGSPPRK